MTKAWREVRRDGVTSGLIDERRVAAHRKVLDEVIVGQRLTDIRKGRGMSQQSVARAMGVTQSRVSRIDSGDLAHTELSTIAAYVRALGGTVSVVAEFRHETIVVS